MAPMENDRAVDSTGQTDGRTGQRVTVYVLGRVCWTVVSDDGSLVYEHFHS